MVMYEAGPGLVFSIDEDELSEWLGTFQEKSASSLKAMHVKRRPLVKSQAEPKHCVRANLGELRNLPEPNP